MNDVVIVSAARTPVGNFNGAFANLSASELGTVAIIAALDRANILPEDVSEVIMGQILTAATGQVTVTLTDAQTAALTSGRYVYDILITDSSGDKTRILEGHATVTPSVSRS